MTLKLYVLSLAIILMIAVYGLKIMFELYVKYKKAYKLNANVIFGVYWAIVGGVLLGQDTIFWSACKDQVQAELACMGGASFGWLIGMWLSPVGSTESTKFTKYWTAIGVGSGFTLKWAVDHFKDTVPFIKAHPFVVSLFVISFLITVAAVYNSRAYDDTLEIFVRKLPGSTANVVADVIEIKAGSKEQFYASVVGPTDPLSSWQIFPSSLGAIEPLTGVFTADAAAGVSGKITAFNIEDPTLSNSTAVKIV